MVFGVHDGPSWVGPGQILGISYTIDVILGATVDSEVGRLVNERSSLGVITGGSESPEGRAEVDPSELAGV